MGIGHFCADYGKIGQRKGVNRLQQLQGQEKTQQRVGAGIGVGK
jgi:hypothetical protein